MRNRRTAATLKDRASWVCHRMLRDDFSYAEAAVKLIEGEETQRDPVRGMKYLKQAADRGHAVAQLIYGIFVFSFLY